MELAISFPGGLRVDASFGSQTIHTDQPPAQGGDGSAPSPFATFLASIGTCVGFYVLSFCRQRGISTEGLHLTQTMDVDPTTGLVSGVHLEIHVPAGFPEKYRSAVVRAAEQCTVKKHLEHPPSFAITTHVETAPGSISPAAA